jgi:hypothetical protein
MGNRRRHADAETEAKRRLFPRTRGCRETRLESEAFDTWSGIGHRTISLSTPVGSFSRVEVLTLWRIQTRPNLSTSASSLSKPSARLWLDWPRSSQCTARGKAVPSDQGSEAFIRASMAASARGGVANGSSFLPLRQPPLALGELRLGRLVRKASEGWRTPNFELRTELFVNA